MASIRFADMPSRLHGFWLHERDPRRVSAAGAAFQAALNRRGTWHPMKLRTALQLSISKNCPADAGRSAVLHSGLLRVVSQILLRRFLKELTSSGW
jgi:hypothetical protein